MIAGTNFVLESEPCFALFERNIMRPDSRGVHRYEILHIIRDWMPYEYRRDMGPECEWKGVGEFRLLGGMLDGNILEAYETVASMRDQAHRIREAPAFDIIELVQDGLWAELTGRPDRLWFS